ncbi:hypothetical protein T440DRAFT_225187 [Plenodomus tracheiphilus IPT5]|uniref:Uncharacterized protein n=1 Tax=Plenodomus tracheiphilus IPT5 TaxID=1408161 RepID=A0A6A7ATR5_9PLEO|nr:hypothetical protein T440DRAFT_225187 [Plenodomus tracheiphilus IPT5]
MVRVDESQRATCDGGAATGPYMYTCLTDSLWRSVQKEMGCARVNMARFPSVIRVPMGWLDGTREWIFSGPVNRSVQAWRSEMSRKRTSCDYLFACCSYGCTVRPQLAVALERCTTFCGVCHCHDPHRAAVRCGIALSHRERAAHDAGRRTKKSRLD